MWGGRETREGEDTILNGWVMLLCGKNQHNVVK